MEHMWIFAYYKYICTHKQIDTFTHKRGLGVKPPLKNVREKNYTNTSHFFLREETA